MAQLKVKMNKEVAHSKPEPLLAFGRRGCGHALRIIERADHVPHNFLAVRLAGAFLTHLVPAHDDDVVRDGKNVGQRWLMRMTANPLLAAACQSNARQCQGYWWVHR
jgi:hypothetical protein